MRELIVIGGGEHARVVMEAASSDPVQWNVLGFVAPSHCQETVERLQLPRLGGDESLVEYPNAALILGIGSIGVNTLRQEVVARLAVAHDRWAVVVHPMAFVSPTAKIDRGSVVLAGAVVNTGARIGSHSIINSNACIEHDATLGSFVHAAPGSIVAGGASIGDGCYLGMGSLVRDHISIGQSCLIGMGAVVTKTSRSESLLIGVPAKRTGLRA
jgi:acetyltransferase EpsM